MCRNGAGQQYFERLCRGANEVCNFETKNWVQRTISAGKQTTKKFRMRLTLRYFLTKGKRSSLQDRWGHFLPPLSNTLVGGRQRLLGDGRLLRRGFKNAASSALGRKKYPNSFMNKEVPPLPIDHAWLIVGGGDDGLPFRTIYVPGIREEISAFFAYLR